MTDYNQIIKEFYKEYGYYTNDKKTLLKYMKLKEQEGLDEKKNKSD